MNQAKASSTTLYHAQAKTGQTVVSDSALTSVDTTFSSPQTPWFLEAFISPEETVHSVDSGKAIVDLFNHNAFSGSVSPDTRKRRTA